MDLLIPRVGTLSVPPSLCHLFAKGTLVYSGRGTVTPSPSTSSIISHLHALIRLQAVTVVTSAAFLPVPVHIWPRCPQAEGSYFLMKPTPQSPSDIFGSLCASRHHRGTQQPLRPFMSSALASAQKRQFVFKKLGGRLLRHVCSGEDL